jgi:nitrate reductase assembly molybdenum cofactor insertion protein NarJ
METTDTVHIRLLKADILRVLATCFDFPSVDRLAAISEMATALAQTDYKDQEVRTMISTLAGSIDAEEALNYYSAIFIKGGVPLNETYVLQKFNAVSDVSAFYRAFGFSPKSGDNPDSIMYELEFLALLQVKIAAAPDEEAAEIAQMAYDVFLKEHTSAFSVQLSNRIRAGHCGVYFSTVSHLLETFISRECEQRT